MSFTLELKNKEIAAIFYFSRVVPIYHDLKQQARSTFVISHLTCILTCFVTGCPFQNTCISNIAVTIMKRNYFKCFAFTVFDYYDYSTIPLHHRANSILPFFLSKFRFRKDIFILIAVLKSPCLMFLLARRELIKLSISCFKILYIQGYFRPVYFSLFYSKKVYDISQKT